MMSLGPNTLSITTEELDQCTTYSAVLVELDQFVMKDKNTVVFAEEVVVVSEVRTEGFDLKIHCRVLRFNEGASIHTSGRSGVPSFLPDQRQVSPYVDGADGIDGRDGGAGQNAGNVEIIAATIVGQPMIYAIGGAGGRGQDGGHGRDGYVGKSAVDVRVGEPYGTPASACGGDGGSGGRAGLPGRRGSSGQGGTITIRVLSGPLPPSSLVAEAGSPAPAADPGKSGVGGAPGRGSTCIHWKCWTDDPRALRQLRLITAAEISRHREQGRDVEPEVLRTVDRSVIDESKIFVESDPLRKAAYVFSQPLRPRYCDSVGEHKAPDGSWGAPGGLDLNEVSARQSLSISQSAQILVETITDSVYASNFRGPILDLLALSIEDEFRMKGSRIDDSLSERINFLFGICLDDEPHKAEIRARAYAMTRKALLGLDFFGDSLESAPLLSFSTYGDLASDAIGHADAIESAFRRYWDTKHDTDARRLQLRYALENAKKFTIELNKTIERSENEAEQLLRDIPGLQLKVEAAEKRLRECEADFVAAIEKKKKHGKCKFANVIVAASTIVSGVAAGGAGLIAVPFAGAKIFGEMKTDNSGKVLDESLLLMNGLQELGRGVKDIAGTVTAVQNAISMLDHDGSRMPRFVMEREQFDRLAREFGELSEAEAYRRAGYDFLRCVEDRNHAILNYNALLSQLIELQAKERGSQRVEDGISSSISSLHDPSSAFVGALMSRLYFDMLSLAAQRVHAEKKALAYHLGRPADAPLSAFSVVDLRKAHVQVGEDWSIAKERYKSRRVLKPGAFAIEIERLVLPPMWQEFKRTGRLLFTIRYEDPFYAPNFKAMPGLRLTGMEIVLTGATANPDQEQVPWRLTHGGYERIYDSNEGYASFSHRVVRFSGTSSISGGTSLVDSDFTEGGLYSGVSPFATWLLALSEHPALGLDLSQLTNAELHLSGYYIDDVEG